VSPAQDDSSLSTESITRWGILGTGAIASDFTEDVLLLGDAKVVAVGSRSQSRAEAFADQYGIPNRHGSYGDLVADPDVDVIYVSTPNPFHYEHAMLAIDGGKSVLVEKPFTLNSPEARDLVAASRVAGVFAMEAMWTRFLPNMVEIREIVESGALGNIRVVTADCSILLERDPTERHFDPRLGGGALLDLGVYALSFVSMVLGAPNVVRSISDPAFTGVDAQTSLLLQHEGRAQAVINLTMEARGANRATIVGENARIEIDSMFFRPTTFSVTLPDGTTEFHNQVHVGNGLRFEAVEVGRCLGLGLLESPWMPLDESVRIMETLDTVRDQIHLVYPQEKGTG
jgi:predicted dehydrogenase